MNQIHAALSLSLATLMGTSILAADKPALKSMEGLFKPSWESLQSYQCPSWFQDAKFGIWAHWGAQCEPAMGDWYARSMYIEGTTAYKFHTTNYGHPSEFGFKDVCNVWKADKFEPEKLINLYKRAGAQYFVMMANHHCNFDNWDSKYQPWNSVKIGPKQDLVGKWEQATRKAGLKFGVTVHAARAWDWYEVAQLSDKNGPKTGVPYDGKLTKADGKGKWWEGLDPQDLYAQNHKPSSDPVDRKNPNRKAGDAPSAAYCEKFYNRVIDLLNSYKPDLLYFDDGVLPLKGVDEAYGLNIASHFYNSSMRWNNGRNEAVMNTKGLNEMQRKCLVWDIERGVSTRVEPFVWQTDTCIGGWHYNRSIYEKRGYKTPTQVVHMLLDIVSKNGNLLLNIPVRGDGTIDELEAQFLEGMAVWMKVNSECVFGTRPWKIFGEGPSAEETPEAGRFGGATDVRKVPYTASDFRFTTKKGALYAVAMAWPADGKLTLRTLGAGVAGIKGEVSSVELLGCKDKLEFKREASGLVVTLPSQKPCEHAFALKITGIDLEASVPPQPARKTTAAAGVASPDVKGSVLLSVDKAQMHGQRVKVQGTGNAVNIGYWDNFKDYVSWNVVVPTNRNYEVVVKTSSTRKENEFTIEMAGQQLKGKAPQTATWGQFQEVALGVMSLPAGTNTLIVRPSGDAKEWKAINLQQVVLKPVK